MGGAQPRNVPLIAFDLEISLAEAGSRVLIARICAQAFSLLQPDRVDVASLEVQAGDETCEEVADRCGLGGIQFVFISRNTAEKVRSVERAGFTTPFGTGELLRACNHQLQSWAWSRCGQMPLCS